MLFNEALEDCFLSVKSVFGLLDDDGARAI